MTVACVHRDAFSKRARVAALFLLCAAGACGDSVTSSAESKLACPKFSAGVQTPARIETSFERIAAITDIRYQAWIDESGIYWFDRAGSLYALPHVQTTPVLLRAAPATQFDVLRMVGDDTHVYWGEADARFSGVPDASPPPPPGRLYAIAKAGGEATLLLEAASDLLTPLAVSDGRVVVQRSTSGLLTVAKDGSSSEPLAANLPIPRPHLGSEAAQVAAGKLYWSVPDPKNSDVNGYAFDLWRANLDGSAAARITRMDSEQYLVAGERILWRRERTRFMPLVLEENYVMFEQASGCTQPLPALGLSISQDAVADASHVYWNSFNGLGALSPGDPEIAKPLIRVDLQSGALEQVVTPGFSATLTDNIIGQTRDRLYITLSGKGLVAIDKP